MFTYTDIQKANWKHNFIDLLFLCQALCKSLIRLKLVLLQNNWMLDAVVFSVHMELRIIIIITVLPVLREYPSALQRKLIMLAVVVVFNKLSPKGTNDQINQVINSICTEGHI